MAVIGRGVPAVVLLLLATAGELSAEPCPEDAVFLHSYAHNGASHCACLDNLACVGSACSRGGSANSMYGFYHEGSSHGFEASCQDCFCVRPGESAAQAERRQPFEWLRTTDGGRQRDFHDALFDKTCRIERDAVVPRPKALHRLKWLHFPKAGSSLSSTIYHYACRGFPGARAFDNLESPAVGQYEVRSTLASLPFPSSVRE
jgi:hypothetical protein